jgi:hypothetical protein
MPAIDFPVPSFIGETYTFNGSIWTWNGYAWILGGNLGPTGPTGSTGSTPDVSYSCCNIIGGPSHFSPQSIDI